VDRVSGAFMSVSSEGLFAVLRIEQGIIDLWITLVNRQY
jgi:hypothetical protein